MFQFPSLYVLSFSDPTKLQKILSEYHWGSLSTHVREQKTRESPRYKGISDSDPHRKQATISLLVGRFGEPAKPLENKMITSC